MSRRKRPPKLSDTQRRLRLERQLSLVHWLSREFGYRDNDAMLEHCKSGDGRHGGAGNVAHILRGQADINIPADKIVQYDGNISRHMDRINRRRQTPITLKYFQQLAALGVEHYLSCLCESRNALLARLNAFVKSANGHRLPAEYFADYTADDLKKVAFWMATGSGKTLLLHLNYLQFLHYFPDDADNILLVTPNESLSEQHLQEFAMSGIAARRVEESADVLSSANPVQVVEITKLVEKRRGKKGVSIPLERFEGSNLLFVDEGHRGAGGEAFFKARDQLGAHGFTFEYSATFGQALFAGGGDQLTSQYGKSILFDYSYRYFHDDGFGKDFSVSNLTGTVEEERMDLLMTGNLLSFYQQMVYFEEQRDALRAYHLEKPLLLMLGSTVTTTQSDVMKLVGFLQRFIKNERGRTVADIKTILAGKSGFADGMGVDLFYDKFRYIGGRRAKEVYQDILRRVFHAETGGALYLRPLKRGKDEIGLKIGENNPYFALIFVGNAKKLCKLTAAQHAVHESEDAISDSLFAGVNAPGSPVNMLIGAKKFMEGWNSWRVTGMGLLNVGKSEGAEIIQLFGRGVRLRGRNLSLKRSAALEGVLHPDHLHLLETLNIFAVRADFIASFRVYLEREGVDNHEIAIDIRIEERFLDKGLAIPKINAAFDGTVALADDDNISVTLDYSERAQSLRSDGDAVSATEQAQDQERKMNAEQLAYLNWNDLYLRLIEHKRRQGRSNLLVRRGDLRRILAERVKIKAPDDYLKPKSFEDIRRLGDIALAGLQKYADRLHHARQMRWQVAHMETATLKSDHDNFIKRYTVLIPREQKDLIEQIEKAARNANWSRGRPVPDLPNIHFDRHLFQPLLLKSNAKHVSVTPAGLVESEEKFVQCLIDYCRDNPEKLEGLELFLLRNLPHRGVGFPAESGDNFYPDFILWVKRGREQRVVFVEPHGLLQDPGPAANSKVKLHKWLAEISQRLREDARGKRERGRDYELKQVEIDSFIVTDTDREELRRRWGADPADNQILFLDEDAELVPKLLKWESPGRR